MAKNVVVSVPHKSTHPLSSRRLGTGTCGTLIPVLSTELVAGSKFKLAANVRAQLAPLATDTFMNCSLHLEAFAVPHRILIAAFPKWLTGEPIRQLQNGSITSTYAAMPYININTGTPSGSNLYDTFAKPVLGPGTLTDYLGMRFTKADFANMDALGAGCQLNFTPFYHLAYHKIWSDWFRNSKIQQDCFTDSHNTFASGYYFAGNVGTSIENEVASSPYQVIKLAKTLGANWTDSFKLADGKTLFDLRQRNFGYDYFTNATLDAQLGASQSVSTSGASFSIASLRAANSIQMWLERSALGSYRWQDYLHAHFGTNLSSGIAQRSIYLGRQIFDVYNKSVETTSNAGSTSPNTVQFLSKNKNPFAGFAGATFGSAFVKSDGRLVDEVEFDEPVILMVIMSLVPKVTYSSGIDRHLMRYCENGSVTEHADALLQNTGNQPIYACELTGCLGTRGTTLGDTVFGYTDRFADWMTLPDTLTGNLRDGENLSGFALQRYVGYGGTTPAIGTNFLEIPKNYLSQVKVFDDTYTASSVTGFDYWFDSYFEMPVSHPLHEYSIPSLQDPAAEHGKKVAINTFSQL